MTPETAGVPSSEGFARADQRRVVAIRRDHIPAVPRGTVIAVAEPLLEEPSLWLVDAMETVRSDQFRVVVIPQEVE